MQPGRGDSAARVVSGDGRAAGSGRRPRRNRTPHRRDRPASGVISRRIAAVFQGSVRKTDRPHGARLARGAGVSPGMKLLMPLRVPELAPSLGRIIVPRRLLDPWVPLDDIREELATRVLELGGEGRAAAAREGDADTRARVLDITGRRAWAAAWDHAVRRAGARVADALDAEITRTARQVRFPRLQLRRHHLSNAEKRAIVARLGTGGGPFVGALGELETAGAHAGSPCGLGQGGHATRRAALPPVARG